MEDTVKRTGRGKFILVQILALALFILPCLLIQWWGSVFWAALVEGFIVALFQLILVVRWPFKGEEIHPGPDRVISSALCFVSLAVIFLLPRHIGIVGKGEAVSNKVWPLIRLWLESAAVLLTILAVSMFARQMLKLGRKMVIRGISATALSSVVAISSTGWVFLPLLFQVSSQAVATSPIVLILVLLLALVLLVGLIISCREWRPSQVKSSDGSSDQQGQPDLLGVSLLPVMISGLLVIFALMALYFLA